MDDLAGFSVKIFMPKGPLDGVRIISKSHWTGQGIAFPRALLREVRERQDYNRSGVYILWERSEPGQAPRAYVGESDEVLTRLDNHDKKKDFWTHGIVFISNDHSLNKAHVKHIEAKLIDRAKKEKLCRLVNQDNPNPPPLSEADRADAQSFMANLLLCLPIMGINFFDTVSESPMAAQYLKVEARGVKAHGYVAPNGFVVKAGSQAAKTETPSTHAYIVARRKELVEQEVLAEKGDVFEFAQDYRFDSPSGASCAVLGQNRNGLTDWKDSQGRTLKQIQSE